MKGNRKYRNQYQFWRILDHLLGNKAPASRFKEKRQKALDGIVSAMKDNESIKITIAGHADERGTREYNLALGQRRAEAVKDYFLLNGISSSRVSVKSYGEEQPVAYGSNEESYAKNRRAEIN